MTFKSKGVFKKISKTSSFRACWQYSDLPASVAKCTDLVSVPKAALTRLHAQAHLSILSEATQQRFLRATSVVSHWVPNVIFYLGQGLFQWQTQTRQLPALNWQPVPRSLAPLEWVTLKSKGLLDLDSTHVYGMIKLQYRQISRIIL